MDDLQLRITEDLSSELQGEIRCDPVTTAIYAGDASLYQVRPLGVAFPRGADDLAVLARYALEQDLPLIPRGAGSNVSGGAVGAGLIVDFSSHMTRLLADDGQTIRVQPGMVLERLNAHLRSSGRYFAPDPASYAITTIGGMVATNAAGSHSIGIGTTRDHVVSLETVLSGGTTFEACRPDGEHLADNIEEPAGVAEIRESLTRLLTEQAKLIESARPAALRNNCGYHVWDCLTGLSDAAGGRRSGLSDAAGGRRLGLSDAAGGRRSVGGLDWPRLLVGSEGTLGMFSAATLRVLPIPAHRGLALLLFGRIESALEAVQAILKEHPTACDLMDRRLLSLAREADDRFARFITADSEAALLVEVVGDSQREAAGRVNAMERAGREYGGRLAARASSDKNLDEFDFLWTLPGKVVPRLTHLKGETRPLPIVEDTAVPPEAMQEYRIRAQKVFQRHKVTATLYAHAGAGQMHFRPFLVPPEAGGSGATLEAIARELYQVVLSLGGVVSGEHGDGLARTAFIRTQYGPLYRIFPQIKHIFDPLNLLNPGKIVSNDPKVTVRHLRPALRAGETDQSQVWGIRESSAGEPLNPEPSAFNANSRLTELKLRWSRDEIIKESIRCNSCGSCRTQEAGLRMCPFVRASGASLSEAAGGRRSVDAAPFGDLEAAAPRSKAAALRAVVGGELSLDDYTGPDMSRLMSHCFNCKQCVRECPSEVDIPHLVIEAKAARVALEDQLRSEWALSRLHLAGPIGNGFSFLANPLLSNPMARWLLEKTVGLARGRKVPRFARRSFLSSLPRRCRTLRTGPDGQRAVIYFVDDYANYFDPELAMAFVRVCERQGFPVFVPPEQVSSGMSLFSAGDIAAARQLAEENLRVLGPYAREGHTIVCTEPSAAVCLKREYPYLLDHPDVADVAARTRQAGGFLWELRRAGRFDDRLEPLNWQVAYHAPCHVRSENPEEPLRQLLALIPRLSLHRIEAGCSGMAGTWGLSRENFQTSLRMGHGLMTAMRDQTLSCGVTECGSCKIQMEQAATRPAIHPLKLLDWSYQGAVPSLPAARSKWVTT